MLKIGFLKFVPPPLIINRIFAQFCNCEQLETRTVHFYTHIKGLGHKRRVVIALKIIVKYQKAMFQKLVF